MGVSQEVYIQCERLFEWRLMRCFLFVWGHRENGEWTWFGGLCVCVCVCVCTYVSECV